MTREEAIKIISNYDVYGCGYCHQGGEEIKEAFDVAIKSLEAWDKVIEALKVMGFPFLDEDNGVYNVLITFDRVLEIIKHYLGEVEE